MTENRGTSGERVAASIQDAAVQVQANPKLLNNRQFLRDVLNELLGEFGGDPLPAAYSAVCEAIRSVAENGQLRAAIEDFQRRIREQPVVMQVLSEPFPWQLNGHTQQRVYCTRIGSGGGLTAVSYDADATEPQVGDYYFTDPEGKMILGPAPTPPQRLEERSPHSACEFSESLPGVGEVRFQDSSTGRRDVLYTYPSLAADIQRRLGDGEQVVVRHGELFASHIVPGDDPARREDWAEFEMTPEAGQQLNNLIFSRRLERELRFKATGLAAGEPVMALFQGPTGSGKSSGARALARTAAVLAGRPLAIIHLSPSKIGSSYVYETERAIDKAVKRAHALEREGYTVLVMIDEANAFLGAGDGRYEGSVDSRVRLALQALLEPIPGAAIILTMNPGRRDSLPAPIVRRFDKQTFPRSNRRQIGEVAALYCPGDLISGFGLSNQEFGQRVADFIFSDQLVLGTIHMRSGTAFPLLARDLHDCSNPGTVKRLIEVWAREMKYGFADSLQALWTRIWDEFRSSVHQISEYNLYDRTFLTPEVHDSVKAVEPASGKSLPQTLVAA